MANCCVVFMLDQDKDFLELYSRLLITKGVQVFATDNLFLLIQYAKTAHPEWIFIDEYFSSRHEREIVTIINNSLQFEDTHFAIMSKQNTLERRLPLPNTEFIYKPAIIKKFINIVENGCNLQ